MSFSLALIKPKNIPSFWSADYNRGIRKDKATTYPLELATVAGIFDFNGIKNIILIDENIYDHYESALNSDVIGITGFPNQKDKIFQLSQFFFNKGKCVIIGGPLATIFPEETSKFCTSVFIGDSESTIPIFINDYKNGQLKKFYAFSKFPLSEAFYFPRFDLIKYSEYSYGMIQTTRGCPFSCEYCAIYLHSGKKVRNKSVSMVVDELDYLLKTKGPTAILIADDNSAANPLYFKKLLKEIILFQEKNNYPFRFGTEITVLIANDDEMLRLMAVAGFYILFLGLETPSKISLNEANKNHLLKINVYDAVKKIQSYGICIDSGGLLGFDNDTKDIFNEHYDFYQTLNIPCIYLSVLYATPGTEFYKRLDKEGRINGDKFSLGSNQGSLQTALTTNIIPKNMSKEEIIDGYKKLTEKLYSFDAFGKRLVGYLQVPVKINNEDFISPFTGNSGVIVFLFKISFFYLIENFPKSFIIYLRAIYMALKSKRLYITFHHLVHFKQTYTYHLKVIKGEKTSTKYDKLVSWFSNN